MPTHDSNDRDPAAPDPADAPDDGSGYDPPEEFGASRPARATATADDLSEAGARPPPPPRRSPGARLAIVVGLLVVAAAALLGYRAWHRARSLAEGTAKAMAALRLDTAAGYRSAAFTLEPLVGYDPRDAASLRAFALASLASDYREADLAAEAEALIARPGRAEQVPAWADLTAAMLFLGRGAIGDAATYANRAGPSPWSGALLARLSMLAGNPQAGAEPLQRALAADPGLPAALAMQGDLARRWRRDAPAARTAYAAALKGSPNHPRAVYGLAKLALASQIPLNEAIPPLRELLKDARATPANERARAALHLASLELRAGDRAAANATLDAVEGLDRPARAWAELAVLIAAGERKAYRAVKDPPALFVTASDDDPLEAAAVDPTPPPPPKAAPRPAAKPGRKAPPPAKKPPAKKPPAKKAP